MKLSKWIFILSILSTQAFAQSNLGMQTSPNFRELGGLTNKDGLSIKKGMVYRSGSFGHLSQEDQNILAKTGINTAIDFRSDFEIAREPDFFPEGMEVNYINAPISNLDQNGMSQFMQVLTKPDFKEEDVDQLMIKANLGFAENIKDFKPLFDQLLVPETVILFHCTAGKDRTGLASSLFLHVLGFDKTTIFEDFMVSNEAVSKIDHSKMKSYGIPEDRSIVLMGVKEVYLETAWKSLEEKYGTLDEMLFQVFGIGEVEKMQLKAKYLSR
jgi:protein-tyrosine phosphatase